MNRKRFWPGWMIVGLCLLLLSSCDKNDLLGSMDTNATGAESELTFFEMMADEEWDLDFEEFDCFDFVYPLQLHWGGEETLVVEDEDALEEAIDEWLELNEGAASYPTFVFPIEVILDEEELSIANEEELCELIYECEAEDDDCDCEEDECEYEDDEDTDWDDLEDCFAFEFPINVLLPDGENVLANDLDELYLIYEDWFEANEDSELDPELVFPFSVTFENGETVEVTNEEGWEEVIEACDC